MNGRGMRILDINDNGETLVEVCKERDLVMNHYFTMFWLVWCLKNDWKINTPNEAAGGLSDQYLVEDK